ncbi:MAG: hypothetical protein JW891_11895 [Candidatus Lokiarchaeota archaeon]|nr:hypothetical protein [Candidatus Lokiarchaeota archaeon]
MQVNYKYASPSMCLQQEDQTILGLSPDLSREEKVSFRGKLKHPLIFRDAMLMLREIVISDMSQKKKERLEFFAWLEDEIERRVLKHEKYLPGVRESLRDEMEGLLKELAEKDDLLKNLANARANLNKEIYDTGAWKEYNKLERKFWNFIRNRDKDLWFVLDPVITVHPDQVSFEAFSLDESTYGCLSVTMDEFILVQEPQLGTTNIDFSAKLSREMERFRTYTNVELSVNPEGFTVETGVMPEYVEKKIDLPETWIKGFNQVSAAASLGGVDLELSPVDMYDICSFLRRHKARKSPRYMKWILEPGKHVKIVLEPWGSKLELKAVYSGDRIREEKVWGRRRWLVMEKIIPIASSFKVRLLGFGMPQFIVADLGTMKMTIGFTSWSSNDWVKGTAFNILGGYIGEGNYEDIYTLLKKRRLLSLEEINKELSDFTKSKNKSGVGMVLKRGEAYYDPIVDAVRFRQLCNSPIPKELYETTTMELSVQEHLEEGMKGFTLKQTQEKDFIATHALKKGKRKENLTKTEMTINQDGQITKVKCDCKQFKKGARNISDPCAHLLSLYITTSKFLNLELKPDREYTINDILEMLL